MKTASEKLTATSKPHLEIWWFYTRLSADDDLARMSFFEENSIKVPRPLGSEIADLLFQEGQKKCGNDEVAEKSKLYGCGALEFTGQDCAEQIYETAKTCITDYFELNHSMLDYLNFSLILIKTMGDISVPLAIKNHTILKVHREEAVVANLSSIIDQDNNSYLN